MSDKKECDRVPDEIEVNSEERLTKVPEENKDLWKSFGVKDSKAGQYFLNQMLHSQRFMEDTKDDVLHGTLAVFHGFKPENELEASLVTQMLAVHSVAMEMSRRAMLPDQTVDGVTANINRTSKFMNLYLKQIDTLMKLKGKDSQSITVKHVNVAEGGQAIVGDVHHGGGSNG